MAREGYFCSTAVLVPLWTAEQAKDPVSQCASGGLKRPLFRHEMMQDAHTPEGCETASYFAVTDMDWSAGGGKRRVTSVVFWERMEMRFAQSENIPFE
jgi:hypothetical protein